MRQLRFLFSTMLAALAALPLTAQQNRRSPHETISAVLGDRYTGNRLTIVYGRPYTRDPRTGEPRPIWGGLVPWEEPYRLGADEATLFLAQKPVLVGDTLIPAGAYTLYLIPSETGPTQLVFSTDLGKWGIPVDTKHDFARVAMAKEALDESVNQLTLAIDSGSGGSGRLKIAWEKTEFSVALGTPAARLDFPVASPPATLRQRIGLTDVEVVYSRPSARGRVMLGGNNPFGQVWRTGANAATRISFSTPVWIEGKRLEAGTYELFSIPDPDQWTVIFQKARGQWGAFSYDPSNDALRVSAVPVTLPHPVETFTIEFDHIVNGQATLELIWEKTRVPVRLDTDVVGLLRPKIEAAMAAPGPKPYADAAMFYFDHDLDLDQAARWIDAALAEHPDAFPLLYDKARILAKEGDRAGAEAAAQSSLDLAAKASGPEKDEYTRLNQALIAGLK